MYINKVSLVYIFVICVSSFAFDGLQLASIAKDTFNLVDRKTLRKVSIRCLLLVIKSRDLITVFL